MEVVMRKLGCLQMTVLAALVATPLVAGCGKTIGETIDDTTITTRVKTQMLNDPNVSGTGIDVDTYKGVVTLSGRVKSQAEHDQAIAIARQADGVTQGKGGVEVIR